jgi:glycosyltransferase involved in cell wall biosynthesis
MRICYYNRLLNEPWGCGIHARSLVENWRAQGHEVLCLPTEPLSPTSEAKPRVRSLAWLPIFARAGAHEVSAQIRAMTKVSRLAKAAAAFSPEMLITRRAGYDYCLDKFLGNSALPYVAETNAIVSRETRLLTGERVLPWERRRESNYLKKAAGAVCVTIELKSQLSGIGIPESRVATLSNGVDVEAFSPTVRPNKAAAEWSEGFHTVYCYAGTRSYTHDTAGLLEIAGRLAAQVPRAGFLFVGPTREELEGEGTWPSSLCGRTYCTGQVAHSEVPSYLVCADVFWASFRNDYGSPLKLYEYMAMAKPVVLAGAGEAVEVVRASRCGHAVARGDGEGLLRHALELGSAPAEQRREMGANGRAWVVNGHSWGDVAAQFLKHAAAMLGR